MKRAPLFLFVLFFVSLASATAVDSAVNWLKQAQNADGSYSAWASYYPHYSVFAGYAVYLKEGNSTNSSAAFNYAKTQLQDVSSYGWGEATIPSIALYYALKTGNPAGINITSFSSQLLFYQNQTGFKGLYECCQWVDWTCVRDYSACIEDAADTAWALIGLAEANKSGFINLNEMNVTAALTYLNLSLQNTDGSINLTSTQSESSLEAFAPDFVSTTSLFLLASNATNSLNGTTQALNYLKTASVNCFSNSKQSMSLALSALAFDLFNENTYANSTAYCLKSLQRGDCGFAGHSNTKRANPFDTALAAIALKEFGYLENSTCSLETNASISLQEKILNGSSQLITVNASGATKNFSTWFGGSANADVTLPNGTILSTTLSYDQDSDAFKGFFNKTDAIGTYAVSITLHEIGGGVFSINASFSSLKRYSFACSAAEECFDGYCVRGFCRNAATFCGDNYCDFPEDSSNCVTDCPAPIPTVQTAPVGNPLSTQATPSPSLIPTPPPQPAQLFFQIDSSSVVTGTFSPNSTGIKLVFTAGSNGFNGTISYKLPLDYKDYLAGMISFEPKPVQVKNGSIVATWKAALKGGENFYISVNVSKALPQSILSNFSKPVLTPAVSKQVRLAPSPTPTPAPAAGGIGGFLVAVSSSLPMLAAIVLAVALVFYAGRRLRRTHKNLDKWKEFEQIPSEKKTQEPREQTEVTAQPPEPEPANDFATRWGYKKRDDLA